MPVTALPAVPPGRAGGAPGISQRSPGRRRDSPAEPRAGDGIPPTQGWPGSRSFLPLLSCLRAASPPARGRGSGCRGMLRSGEGPSHGGGTRPGTPGLPLVLPRLPQAQQFPASRAFVTHGPRYRCSHAEQRTVPLEMMKQSQMTHFLSYRKFLALLQDLKAVIIR